MTMNPYRDAQTRLRTTREERHMWLFECDGDIDREECARLCADADTAEDLERKLERAQNLAKTVQERWAGSKGKDVVGLINGINALFEALGVAR
jgi:hypothetical protein